MTTFALTGATGLLGRNLLLEIIKQNRNNLENIEILILGRSTKTSNLHDRVMDIIKKEAVDYIDDSKINPDDLFEILERKITNIDICLTKKDLGIDEQNYKKISSRKIDFFFHAAALTDFRDGIDVEKDLERTNIFGTQQVLNLVKKLQVSEFIYISSAYVCGLTTGNVMPDYVNLDQKFRNPYEKTKLKAEISVRNFQKETGVKCRIFRPSTICGRLIEKEIGSTPKFDVFYSWGAFFLRYKQKALGVNNCINTPFEVSLRFCASSKSGLNIVPVDYAVKAIYMVCASNCDGDSYHLVNKKETPHHFYFPAILDAIGIKNAIILDDMPKKLNQLEKFYFKTVGKIFTPYISQNEIGFNDNNLDKICNEGNLKCPVINQANFPLLMAYAKAHNFGT